MSWFKAAWFKVSAFSSRWFGPAAVDPNSLTVTLNPGSITNVSTVGYASTTLVLKRVLSNEVQLVGMGTQDIGVGVGTQTVSVTRPISLTVDVGLLRQVSESVVAVGAVSVPCVLASGGQSTVTLDSGELSTITLLSSVTQ